MIRDITRALSNGFPSWPGDPVLALSAASSLARGDLCDVTRISMSAHSGTHLDAPSHVLRGGASLDSVPLDLLVGPAHVVHVAAASRIGASDLRAAMLASGLDPDAAGGVPRLLLRTGSAETLPEPPRSFASLAPDSAGWLIERGVRLIGIDTPSVDAPEAAALPVHGVFAAAGASILEWLDLREVPPGPYQLVALPLRLAGCEAAPVRAILLDLPATP